MAEVGKGVVVDRSGRMYRYIDECNNDWTIPYM